MRRALVLVALLMSCKQSVRERAPADPESPIFASVGGVLTDQAVIVSEGLSSPEAIVRDPVDDVYLVSNINGSAEAADDNGYIARLSPDGTMLDAHWIDGARPDVTLHAPRGMVLDGDTLYVADLGAVRVFDRATGAPKGSLPLPGSRFPNDLAVDDAHDLWVTDTGILMTPDQGPLPRGIDRIYRFAPGDQLPTIVATGKVLAGPNGIEWSADGPVIVAFKGNIVYHLGAEGIPAAFAQLPVSGLDGLATLPDGSFLVTSWEARAVYHVTTDGHAWVVAHGDDLVTPASIAYDETRHRLLLPLLLANQIRFEPVTIGD